MTLENISQSISTKECCRPRQGLNPRPPGLQSDGASNCATEAGCPKFRSRFEQSILLSADAPRNWMTGTEELDQIRVYTVYLRLVCPTVQIIRLNMVNFYL